MLKNIIISSSDEVGATNQTIDLPLISYSDVLPSSANQGRASIAITGMDYARNPFTNAGELGNETLDLATIYVQRRAPTTIANEYFSLNRENGLLLPGSMHTFSMQLTDGNGLDSLDSVVLMQWAEIILMIVAFTIIYL